MILCVETSAPWVGGLAFLEMQPPKFLCLSNDNSSDPLWKDCSKSYICENDLNKD
jgi:hypothetical protein